MEKPPNTVLTSSGLCRAYKAIRTYIDHGSKRERGFICGTDRGRLVGYTPCAQCNGGQWSFAKGKLPYCWVILMPLLRLVRYLLLYQIKDFLLV